MWEGLFLFVSVSVGTCVYYEICVVLKMPWELVLAFLSCTSRNSAISHFPSLSRSTGMEGVHTLSPASMWILVVQIQIPHLYTTYAYSSSHLPSLCNCFPINKLNAQLSAHILFPLINKMFSISIWELYSMPYWRRTLKKKLRIEYNRGLFI